MSYPKEKGWHWYRTNPLSHWMPKEVVFFEEQGLCFGDYEGVKEVVKTNKHQWGGKIEEPVE